MNFTSTYRLRSDLFEPVKERADRESRTFNNMVAVLVAQAMKLDIAPETAYRLEREAKRQNITVNDLIIQKILQ